jgi:hypothetical protein
MSNHKTFGGVVKTFLTDLIALLPGQGAERAIDAALAKFNRIIEGLSRAEAKAVAQISRNVSKIEADRRRFEETHRTHTAHNDKLAAIAAQALEARQNLSRMIAKGA